MKEKIIKCKVVAESEDEVLLTIMDTELREQVTHVKILEVV